jgi:hypothetical protein
VLLVVVPLVAVLAEVYKYLLLLLAESGQTILFDINSWLLQTYPLLKLTLASAIVNILLKLQAKHFY